MTDYFSLGPVYNEYVYKFWRQLLKGARSREEQGINFSFFDGA